MSFCPSHRETPSQSLLHRWRLASLALASVTALTIGALPAAIAGEPPELPELPDIEEMTRFPATPADFYERYPDAPRRSPGLFRRPDLDGDTCGDLIFQSVGYHPIFLRVGEVQLRSGWAGAALATVTGEAPNDLFGWVAEGAGDFTGDGSDDLLVSAPASSAGAADAGRVYVYSAVDGALRLRVTCGVARAGFGWSAATLGDVDGDGRAEILVGAPMGDLPGFAAVFRGAATGSPVDRTLGDAWLTVSSGQVHDGFGFSVASAGDVNGDGRMDFIVGAPYHNAAPGAGAGSVNNHGAAFVYSGLDGSLLFSVKGAVAGMYAGYSVSAAGDLNGDGFADVVVAAPGTVIVNLDGAVENSGDAAYVFFGGPAAGAPAMLTTAHADLVLTPSEDDGFAFGVRIELGNDATGDGRRATGGRSC